MENTIINVQVNQGTKYRISAFAIPCGSDWSIIIQGGTLPHIGGAAIAGPAQNQTHFHGLPLPNHRDDVVALLFAKELSEAFHCNVSASAGIHIDNASVDEIRYLTDSAEKCCQLLIAKMKLCFERKKSPESLI